MPEHPKILSPEQQQVVNAQHGRFVVTAAAGAGKTYVLVERYLRHVVEEGLRPDQILTITFTKKAAAVMKGRIVKALREQGLMDHAQIAETGPIQTIHSFCERLLRENSLEAGLDPGFGILTEAQSSRLVAECVREALASDLEDAPQAETLIAFLAGKRQAYGGNKSPYSLLEGAVEDVLQELRSSTRTQLEIAQWHASPSELERCWEDRMVAALPEDVQAALADVEADWLQERISDASKATGKRVPSWARARQEPEAEREALHHVCGLVQLACSAWWRLQREMDRLQALDFTELEARAVRLLSQSAATRERMRQEYRVAMVDEAQDVNPIQFQLLGLLDIEREMLVGDAQQSIYGFRQADVRTFRERSASLETLRLSKNYRSDEGILSFVDLLFGQLWSGDYVRMNKPAGFDLDNVVSIDCSGVELWKQPAQDKYATADFIAELLAEGAVKKDVAVLVRDSSYAVELKKRLDDLSIDCKIAGGSEKFYTRLEVRDLANALRAVADPYDDFSLLACLRSPMAGLTLDSIVLLGKEPNVAERLASFEPPVEEDVDRLRQFLKWFEPLRKLADRLSAWEVLGEIFARSDYLAALARRPDAEQLLANVRKLLSLAAQEPELGPIEYSDRIREIQELRHKEGDAPAGAEDADVVTIMTIHKSKGLEFPIVVVPQTDRRLAQKPKELTVEPRLGLVATRFGKAPCMMHRWLSELKREREEAEELRVLYVALTRAEKRLCICLYPPRNYRTLSKAILDVVGQNPPPGVRVREPKDMEAVAVP